MTLAILPPDLLTSPKDAGTTTNNKFDTMEWMPSSLSEGASVLLRPMGTFATDSCAMFYRWPVEQEVQGDLKFSGYDFSSQWPGDPAPNAARQVDWSQSSRPKIEGSAVRPKRALVWTVFNQETGRMEVAIIEQRSLKDGIKEIIAEGDDYTFTDEGVANFVLKVTRKGTGLDTSYSVLPKLSKPSKAELAAFEEVKDTAKVSLYLECKHPLRKPAAEFSSTAPAGDSEF